MGMGYSLISRFADFENIFLETLREAEAHLGFSLSNLLKEGPAEKLKETEITQPALLTVSTACGRWLMSKGFKAEIALGHSLGEYSALVYAGAMRFSDAVKLVQLRGRLMQNAVPMGKAGMGALLGADLASAKALIEKVKAQTPKVLEISLLNAPGQIVVSGEIEAIGVAAALAREVGIRKVVLLEVSGPFHCSMLEKAGLELGKALSQIEILEPRIPVISNTTARPITHVGEIRKNLEAQVSQTVLWEDSVRYAHSQGFHKFVEVGSGNVLSGLVKKIIPEAETWALESIQNVEEIKI